MKSHIQYFFLICLLIIGIIASNLFLKPKEVKKEEAPVTTEKVVTEEKKETKKYPSRNWNVSDPVLDAESVMVYSLDSNFSYYNLRTYEKWPIASVTKLLTTVVLIEDIGIHKKIPITKNAIATEGTAGDFRSGETYEGQDLATIMLLSSSNDAAVAIQDYAGGNEVFSKMLNAKAASIGMNDTSFSDPSGLSPKNLSTANDLIKLARYIAEKHPEILSWTRLQSFLVQPTNSIESRVVYNINPFAKDFSFLGGKTGTSPEARENLLAFFTYKNERVICVILGSRDRVKTKEDIFTWIDSAYLPEAETH